MDRKNISQIRQKDRRRESGLEHSVLLDPSLWGWRLLVRMLIVLNVLGVLGIAVISYRAEKPQSVTASPCPPCTEIPAYLKYRHGQMPLWQVRL